MISIWLLYKEGNEKSFLFFPLTETESDVISSVSRVKSCWRWRCMGENGDQGPGWQLTFDKLQVVIMRVNGWKETRRIRGERPQDVPGRFIWIALIEMGRRVHCGWRHSRAGTVDCISVKEIWAAVRTHPASWLYLRGDPLLQVPAALASLLGWTLPWTVS